MDKIVIEAIVEEYGEIDQKIKALELEKKALSAQLKEVITLGDDVVSAHFKASLIERETVSYDTDKVYSKLGIDTFLKVVKVQNGLLDKVLLKEESTEDIIASKSVQKVLSVKPLKK